MKNLVTASLLLLTFISCTSVVPGTPTGIPTFGETAQASPSAIATFEALATAMPDSGNVLDPHGTPVQEWRAIPIMPAAIAGQEFRADNAYSFRASATAQEVQDFYDERLTQLGWTQPFDTSFNESGGMMTFRKEGSSLAITVTSSGNSVVVLLVMTLA